MSCGNENKKQTETKTETASNTSDPKCDELIEKLRIVGIEKDSARNNIINLMTGIGEHTCNNGSNCSTHKSMYQTRDSILIKYSKIELEFQNELAKSSKQYRIKYYKELVENAEITSKEKTTVIENLLEGNNGYTKCTRGEECPTHREYYKQRDLAKLEFDSLTKILVNLK
jgi:hypothetical protein